MICLTLVTFPVETPAARATESCSSKFWKLQETCGQLLSLSTSTGEETLFYHTCKSRACRVVAIAPHSCGKKRCELFFLILVMPALALPCQTCSGPSLSRTATYFM